MNQLVLKELEHIRQENDGLLRPEDVVQKAEDSESLLHPYFDWDDSEAARKWRLEQARRLIRVAVIIIEPEQTSPVRAYVSLLGDRPVGNGYRTTVEVLADAGKRRRLLQQALSDLAVFRRKYALLSELAEVFAAADYMLDGDGVTG